MTSLACQPRPQTYNLAESSISFGGTIMKRLVAVTLLALVALVACGRTPAPSPSAAQPTVSGEIAVFHAGSLSVDGPVANFHSTKSAG